MSTPTTSATCGASAKATDPVPQPASSAASSPLNGASRRCRRVGEIGCALLLEGKPEIDAHDPATSRAERPSEREGVLARRDRPRCPLLVDGVEDTSDLGAGLDSQLVAAHERRLGIGATRSLHDSDELLRADECQRVERPRLRLAAEAVDCARRWVVGLPRAPECARVALELVRDGEPSEVLAEGDDESEVGIVERVEALVESAAERLEQADLVQAPVPRCGQSLQLRQHALAGRSRHERGRRAQERLRTLVHLEPQLVLEAHGAQESKRVVDEDGVRHRPNDAVPQVVATVVRVVGSAGLDALGDRVEREVARREVGVDPVGQRGEVHRLVDAVGDHAPGAMALGEREHGAAEAARESMGRVARIGAGDVDVEDGTQEKRVPNRTSDDPGALAAQDLADPLIHRRRPAERVRNGC